MKISPRNVIIGTVAAVAVGFAAASGPAHRLTVRRVAELTAPKDAPHVKGVRVEIDPFGTVALPVNAVEKRLELIREFPYPTEFQPPEVSPAASPLAVVPSTPTNFEKLNVGWTIRLSAKAYGKLVVIAGVADYVEVELVASGYGAASGAIYDDSSGVEVTPNRINQPKSQTTTTRFQIFAVPTDASEITLYRGGKAEKHRVVVTAE